MKLGKNDFEIEINSAYITFLKKRKTMILVSLFIWLEYDTELPRTAAGCLEQEDRHSSKPGRKNALPSPPPGNTSWDSGLLPLHTAVRHWPPSP